MINNFKIDFVGIGAMKAATTWIYECLREHPEIEIAHKDQRSIAFFFKQEPSQEDIKEYISYFKKADSLKGDYHVEYLRDGAAMWRMKKHNDDIKIIVCLRNPLERAWSHYNYYKFYTGKRNISFGQAVEESPDILDAGLYYKYLKSYFRVFERDKILILFFEDIASDKVNFIRGIYKFLGVDISFIPSSLDVKINLTAFKQTLLGNFFHNKILGPFLRNYRWGWEIKKSVIFKKAIARFSEFWGGTKEGKAVSPEIYSRLEKFYRADIEKLQTLINRDLSRWV